jgi:3-hydroxyacyl-CoA dehydrogenase/enoyl-CoA hydratase/3-hydroxybutyryl-CoA epimerase
MMKKAIKVSINDSGIAEVIFDLPGSSVNLLATEVLLELEGHLDTMKEDKNIKAVFFLSAKEDVFIAGADISEVKAFENEQDAYEKVRQGQRILGKIAHLPFHTIAVINGACLGGGLELALCCDFRLATDGDKTKIGLPEVNLGVMPGFGGTQRLRRLCGLKKALELILGAKLLNGEKAELLGIVDACVPKGYLDFKRDSFLEEVLDEGKRAKIVSRRHKDALLERFFPGLILRFAHKEVMGKTKGHYPAPLAVLELYEKVRKKSFEEALEMEARSFARLSITDVSKNLIALFFTSEALKKENWNDEEADPAAIKRVAVIGAGIMGSGIIWLMSKMNLQVRMKVLHLEDVAKAFASIYKMYEAIRKRRRLTRREIDLKMGHISYDTEFRGLGGTDICIEAIIEDAKAKKELYATLESIVDAKTIIATNTSSLSITSLASEMKHPERFVGMHFFNPVNRMPLVEVIPGEKSSPYAVATVVSLAKQAGKTPIVVGDCAGFLVNRVLLPYINEAVLLFEEGEEFTKIDDLLVGFGMPMGPFTLADEVGLDVGLKVAKVLHNAYGERIKVASVFDAIVSEKKLLGKKARKGFYLHRGKERSANPEVLKLVEGSTTFDEAEIIDRTMLVMVNEAARCLEEGIVKNADYLDMAMVMGTGFPPFRGGLMRYAQQRGLQNVVVTLHHLADAYGLRFEPADLLVRMAENGERFYQE